MSDLDIKQWKQHLRVLFPFVRVGGRGCHGEFFGELKTFASESIRAPRR